MNKQERIALYTAGASIGSMLALFLMLSVSSTDPELPPSVAKRYIEHWVTDAKFEVGGNMALKHAYELEQLYTGLDFQPIWLDNYKLNSAGQSLVQSLKETASDQFKAYNYRISRIEGQIARLTNQPKKLTAIDVLLSDAFIGYAGQVLNKDLLPNTGELDHPSFRHVAAPPTVRITPLEVANMLSQSVKHENINDFIVDLVPQHKGYKSLSHELMRYQQIAESGLWFPIEEGPELQLNSRDRRVPQLRWMLEAYGDIPSDRFEWFFQEESNSADPMIAVQKYIPGSQNPIYQLDEVIVSGLKTFQARNRLEKTGILDDATRNQLNTPPYLIAQQIALNMKRFRYLPDELGDTYVLVNMADYRLQYKEKGQVKADMKVIIGAPNRRTPVLAENISTIVLAPKWNVPYRIAHGDILPKAKEDPNYLKDNEYQVVEGWTNPPKFVPLENLDFDRFNSRENAYRLIQSPGKLNSLGAVKFVIPNDKSIYLHDTSHPELFAYRDRALSSGCIRVAQPQKLAKLLLKNNPGWNSDRIEQTVDNKETTFVHLRKSVPVYLMYWTAWVDENRQLQLRPDVYRRDQVNVASKKYRSIIL